MASALLQSSRRRIDGQAKQQMAQPIGEASEQDATRTYARRVGLGVRVWRVVGGAPLVLFTYAGEADAAVVQAVMQLVRRLTAAIPGDWRVEVIGAGIEGALLRVLEHDLGDLRRKGIRPRLALAPRLRPELRALLAARSANAASGSARLAEPH
jgi:hypothetical protein